MTLNDEHAPNEQNPVLYRTALLLSSIPQTNFLLCAANKFQMKNKKHLRSMMFLYLFIIILSSCDEVKYVEYKPHYLSSNSDKKYFGEPYLDPTEFANTVQVLEYYGEDFKTKSDNVILISNKLSKDWELLWNYTNKAEDYDWLSTHKRNKN